jgi:cytochrome c biogenesis protein CcmG/thiol:disulfide interchange protein DsbE
MTQRKFAFFSLLIVATAFFSLWATKRSSSSASSARPANSVKVGFQTGNLAPDFELRSLDGHRVTLSELRGRPVLLNFWATWCAPCRVEMPWLVQFDQQYRSHGVQIIGVSLDDSGAERDVAVFANDKGVKYNVLFGNSSVADAYGGVRFMPQSFFIDREGKITKTSIGLTSRKDLENGIKALLVQ